MSSYAIPLRMSPLRASGMGTSLTAAATTAPGPAVLAHRGFHVGAAPYENTVEAFRNAAAAGADFIELDVRRTRDGVLVVHHDDAIGAVKIADMDFRDLPRIGDGTSRVPTLDEAIAVARQMHVRMAVELKEEGYEALVVDRLLDQLAATDFRIITFNKGSIAAVKLHRPEVRAGLLVYKLWDWAYKSPLWTIVRHLLNPLTPLHKAREAGADFVAVHHSVASDRLLDEARWQGMPVAVWTVNGDGGIRRFVRDARVAGVITDRPDAALRERAAAIRA